jgi:hypothetical protein
MNKINLFYLLFIIVIMISCKNSNTENKLPNPPPKEPKYILIYKDVNYPFNSEIARKNFLDSIGISIDTSKHIQ